MTLESTIICVDNSEYSRNGDFTPSRLGAQQDVLQTVSRTKLRQNPENNVGLIAVGGRKPVMINTLTSDTNKLLSGFARIIHDGENNNFSTSLRIAHLALKHRTSKNHRQRILILVCSPMVESEGELVKLAKKLKKENVNVDVVNFGEDEVNVELLAKFIETLNGKNNDPQCHLVNVPAGSNLNDGVRMSRICGNEPQAAGMASGAMENGGMEDWMDDPNMDPDLALALRVSLEESRARQQQEATQNPADVPETVQEESTATDAATTSQEPAAEAEVMDGDDDAELMRALEMSLAPGAQDPEGGSDEEGNEVNEEELAAETVDLYENMTEEEQIEFALKMSMADADKDNDDMAE